MSAQPSYELETSTQGQFEHGAHIGLTLLQGGQTQDRPVLGEMPTPRVESAYRPATGREYELPPAKFVDPAHVGRVAVFAQ